MTPYKIFVVIMMLGCYIGVALPVHAEYADEQFSQNRTYPILHVPAKNLTDVLSQLVELRVRMVSGEEVELPVVSITAGSKTFTGRVIDAGLPSDKNASVLMETNEGQGRFNSTRLAYLRLSDINAIEIHDAWSKGVQSTLEIGAVDILPAPTKVDLKRKMANFSTWLTENAGHPIAYELDVATLPANDDLLRTISSVMNESTGVLYELIRNGSPLSKELKTVVFTVAKDSSAKYSNGVVTLSINGASPRSYRRGEARRYITECCAKH